MDGVGLGNSGSTNNTEDASDNECNITPRNQLTSSSSSSYSFSVKPSPQKNSFSSNNSSDPGYLSASFVTPDHSPVKANMTTPEALKNVSNIIDDNSLGYDLIQGIN